MRITLEFEPNKPIEAGPLMAWLAAYDQQGAPFRIEKRAPDPRSNAIERRRGYRPWVIRIKDETGQYQEHDTRYMLEEKTGRVARFWTWQSAFEHALTDQNHVEAATLQKPGDTERDSDN